ncbi:MAG: hypothetical protein RR540_03960 [Oscillospiraceae bacterium]
MSKTYVSKQVRNLLINSEIINKKEHSEFKEILLKHSKIDEKTLSADKISEKTEKIIKYTVNIIYDSAKMEWEGIQKFDDGDVNCSLCGAKNKYIYYIKNKFNKKELNVGSDCIKGFSGLKTNKNTNFGDYIKSISKNQKQVKRKLELYSKYPELDMEIKVIDKRMNESPLLLPKEISQCLNQFKIKINNFIKNYLSGKCKITELAFIRETLKNYEQYYKDYYKTWIEENINNTFCITSKMKFNIEKTGQGKEILEKISNDGGIVNANTIENISVIEFIKLHLSTFSKKMEDFNSLKIVNGQITTSCKNASFNFLPLVCKPNTFMKKFGKDLFSDGKIEFKKINDTFAVESSDDAERLCEYLEDEVNKRNNITYKIYFRRENLSSNIYVLFSEKLTFAVFKHTDFVRKVLQCSQMTKSTFVETYYKNILSKIKPEKNFKQGDSALVEKLNLTQSIWIKSN